MSETRPARPIRRVTTLAAGGILLIAGACMIPTPDRRASPMEPDADMEPQELPVPVGPEAEAEPSKEPTYTPYDVPPRIVNREELLRSIQAAYPPLLREAGIDGQATLHVYLDDEGTVESAKVYRGSGHPQLDEAALRVIRTARFTAAENRGRKVPVWIAMPIKFSVN